MNKIEEIVVPSDKCYLREVMDVLPSHVLLNKGMTGCGGTTLELESPRNSIILVPTINLVENKSMNNDKVFGLYGLVKDNELLRYLYDSTIKYKKIIATYDSLLKLLGLEIVIPNIRDYFLLVDEYHTLFVYYKFRYGAMRYLLSAYKEFKDWCFMSATPLNEYNVLEELKGIDIINMRWEDKARLDIKYSPTESALVLLQQRIYECLQSDYNLHIFFNSFRSIRKVIEKVEEQVGILDYRVVCSYSRADRGVLRCKDINSDVCKINFYTATAHDGCDIFDENGKTIIVSDDTIISTMMDISIHIIQIAGRLRNSKYINQIEWIYSSRKHRYLMKSEDEWEEFVKDNERSGREVLSIYEKTDSTVHVEKGKKVVKGEEKIIEKKYCERWTYLKSIDYDVIQGFYINYEYDKGLRMKTDIFYDENLRMCDFENYRLFKSLSALYTQKPKVVVSDVEKEKIIELYSSDIEKRFYGCIIRGKEYTREEVENILESNGIVKKENLYYRFFEDNFSKDHFSKKRGRVRGKVCTIYTFY